jgi:ankyrin repeat protein
MYVLPARPVVLSNIHCPNQCLLCFFACFLCVITDAAVWLCAHGADVRAQKQDDWGDTAMHYAAAKGHWDMADLLLAFGVDPAAINFAGGPHGLCLYP